MENQELTQDQAWEAYKALEAAHPLTAAIKELENQRWNDPAITAARLAWNAIYTAETEQRDRARLAELAERYNVAIVAADAAPADPETYDADMNREEARLFPDFYPQPTLTPAEVADVEGLTVHVYNALATSR